METVQALKFCKLLHHPKFKDKSNISVANKSGYISQGVGDHMKGTSTPKLIHKLEKPKNDGKCIAIDLTLINTDEIPSDFVSEI